MRSKYLIFVSAILLMAITGANAAYDYSIPVGTHEVRFNTSLPIWEIITSPSMTSLGYESQYLPTYPSGSYDNPMFTYSSTLLSPKKSYPWWPTLHLTVRDFEKPIPWAAMYLEMDTLNDFISSMPGSRYIGGDYIIFSLENKSYGGVIKWPSDRTEIIITGCLSSIESWRDISNSTELVR